MPEIVPDRRPAMPERLILWHLGVMSVGCAWAFGGQAPWARTGLLAAGTVGAGIFLWCALSAGRAGGPWWRPWRWIWPLLVFDVLTGLAAVNPSFREVATDTGKLLVQQDPPFAWLPSSAVPRAALRELWLLNGIVFSCHNLVFVSSRRALRIFLLALGTNAVALAVMGTFQELLGADGPWYGLVAAPNQYFFATFIYHNHWGAFALVHAAIWGGLLFHHFTRPEGRDAWHSPFLAGAVGALLLATTAPLSGSRSSTFLLCLLLLGASMHLALAIARDRRARGRSAAPPLFALALAGAVAAGAIAWLGRPMIERRLGHTARQVAAIRDSRRGEEIARVALYRDTWRMASDRPWFGWGLESYARVFQIYNSQRPPEPWFRVRRYAEAHNDWLQSLAETGFVGTALVLLLGALPVVSSPWRRAASRLPRYLLAGAGLVLLYAAVEFPFANPSVLLAFWTVLYAGARYARLDTPADG